MCHSYTLPVVLLEIRCPLWVLHLHLQRLHSFVCIPKMETLFNAVGKVLNSAHLKCGNFYPILAPLYHSSAWSYILILYSQWCFEYS